MAGVAAALCVGALAVPGAVGQTEPRIDDAGTGRTAGALDTAQQAYEEGRWEAACRQFAALADGGDAEAARIAWLMHRHGLPLYRSVLPASDAQRVRWQHLSATVAPMPFRPTSTWAWQPVVDVDAVAEGRPLPASIHRGDHHDCSHTRLDTGSHPTSRNEPTAAVPAPLRMGCPRRGGGGRGAGGVRRDGVARRSDGAATAAATTAQRRRGDAGDCEPGQLVADRTCRNPGPMAVAAYEQ